MAQRVSKKDLDNQGRSVVWIAANKGHTSILELLMSHGADINTAYQEGVTLLIEASKASESDSVQLLLSKGADVAATDNQGKTAIQYAFEDNNLEIVKALLAHGADVSTNDHAYSPLLLAVLQGDVSKVKQVLSEAADQADLMRMLNHQSVFTHALGRGLPQSEGGWTPLLLACEEGQVEIVNAILTSAKSEASTLLETVSTLTEYTPLMHACKNNNLKLAKMLISFGAVVKAEYEEGETAEDVAAMFAQHEVQTSRQLEAAGKGVLHGLSVPQPFSLTSQIPAETFPTQNFLAQTYHQESHLNETDSQEQAPSIPQHQMPGVPGDLIPPGVAPQLPQRPDDDPPPGVDPSILTPQEQQSGSTQVTENVDSQASGYWAGRVPGTPISNSDEQQKS
ncbi:hypothetical protein WJX82_002718 [Trebouxia sp. C0006]